MTPEEQREKERERLHQSYLRHKEEKEKRRDARRRANLEAVAARQREYRQKNAEATRARARAWYAANKERALASYKSRNQRIRQEMLAAYGGRCACCGESETRFLTLDHINGGGRAHRQTINAGGSGIAFDLKRKGWPQDGYQLLCYNCNCGRALNGGICPHEQPGSTNES